MTARYYGYIQEGGGGGGVGVKADCLTRDVGR